MRRKIKKFLVKVAIIFIVLSSVLPIYNYPKAAKITTINLVVAGDTNMVEFFRVVSKEYIKQKRNVSVNIVGTGPGDPGSQAIFTKLNAQAKAGAKKWDIDVAVVHQSIMGDMLKEKLLLNYVDTLKNKKYIVGKFSENALGTNVKGYVVPMFQSQVVIAYRPEVNDVPKTFEELVKWIKKNPKKFGYNGVKGGMSGVGFVVGWIYWKTGDYKKLVEGPYNHVIEAKWKAAIKELKALPVTITNGNAGTLDMLNRGEIMMGPVWMDMYYTWVREGRLDPSIKIKLIKPGLPGQPMYFVIPKKAANKEIAINFVDFMSSPEIQAKFIVERNGWLPGIEPNVVMKKVDFKIQTKLFENVSAEDIQNFGLQFPLVRYLQNILRSYEMY